MSADGMAIEIECEVELAAIIGGTRPVVIARVGGPNFRLTPHMKLGGRAIEPRVGVPRSLDAAGKPRLDVFAFQLRDAADLACFARGQRVILSGVTAA
jgi:hypothetical protein